VTATEFHQRLRAGHLAGGARRMTPHPPELVGQAIVFAIKTGEAHVLVADPPRPIVPENWGGLLAGPGPGVSPPATAPGAPSGDTTAVASGESEPR